MKHIFSIIALTVIIILPRFSQAEIRDQLDLDLLIEGDIIFQQSQTDQAPAVGEATNSEWTHVGIVVKRNKNWYVAEARGPLQITPIYTFIGRSQNNSFRIVRFKYFDPQTMIKELYRSIYRYNQPYDIYFEFSDERIYCSELVYKVFKEITGRAVGELQKIRDLRTDGPYVRRLIAERLESIGKELNYDEPIVTPVSQLNDTNVKLIQASPK